MNLVYESLTTVLHGAHSRDFAILSSIVLTHYLSVTSTRTDGRTDIELRPAGHDFILPTCNLSDVGVLLLFVVFLTS